MNETKITGGKVSYGLTRSRKQYESDRADVEVSFTVADGDTETAILDKSCASAMRRVHEMLGIPLPAVKTDPAPEVPKTSGLFG